MVFDAGRYTLGTDFAHMIFNDNMRTAIRPEQPQPAVEPGGMLAELIDQLGDHSMHPKGESATSSG